MSSSNRPVDRDGRVLLRRRSKPALWRQSKPAFCRVFGLAVIAILFAAPGQAKNHLWKFSELYSNSDGTIQFIEMQECCGSDVEVEMSTADITTNSGTYSFPNDLSGPTANTRILIATAGFAALPGAPTPDYVIPDRFFEPTGDEVKVRYRRKLPKFLRRIVGE